MVSAICNVNNTSIISLTPPYKDGYNSVPSGSITITLSDTTSVDAWNISCTSTDDKQVAATINASLTINNTAKTCTFTLPSEATGCALQFTSIVNGGVDSNGTPQAVYKFVFGIWAIGSGGQRLFFANETLESSHIFGWMADANAVQRGGVGGGFTAGGDLSGTSTNQTVAKLDGYSIALSTLQKSDIITYNGTTLVNRANDYLNILDYGGN